jgi:hypothetical protein
MLAFSQCDRASKGAREVGVGDQTTAVADALEAIIEAVEGTLRASAELPDPEVATSVRKAVEAGHFSLQEALRRLGR